MPIITLLCGLPGSGKTTYAKKMLKHFPNSAYVSTDDIRAELGDVTEQTKNNKFFAIAGKRTREALLSKKDVIFDACNISRRSRRGVLQNLGKIACTKHCVIIWSTFEECLVRNHKRDRVVPKYVIENMYKGFQTPALFEGFDEIFLDRCNTSKLYSLEDTTMFDNFDQENSHHTLTLGEHQRKAYEYVSKRSNEAELKVAALIHDCGKPFTKEFNPAKNEYSYYSHDNVGAYNALGYTHEIYANNLDISLLVNLHMQPYHWKHATDPVKAEAKCKDLWGDELYRQVRLLHEADLYAH